MSALDRTMLDTSKVLLFIKIVDALDRERVGPLLETDEGLMPDWAMIKGVCSCVEKRRDSNDTGSIGSGQGRLCGRDHTTICLVGRTCVWKI